MKKRRWFLVVYAMVLTLFILFSLTLNNAVTVISESMLPVKGTCFVIDAGHGGVDGGASSHTGILESNINLQISLRLNDLMHLLGADTVMIRTEDISVYTQGDTIAAKKVSDLKERVRIVNSTENAVLVSIHQNYFSDSRYAGAQVFYGSNPLSESLANQIQDAFITSINPNNNRRAKAASGIYLLQKATCPAVLIECGFLSNYEEEAKLLEPSYQMKLCCVIATELSEYANT